jgi:hypothetical protein
MSKPAKDKDLPVEISFLEGLRSRMPLDADVLKLLGDDYTRAKRWQEGLDIDLELARLLQTDPYVFYNLACSHSLLGNMKGSVDALKKAIQLGYSDFNYVKKDADLDNLRKSPEFKEVWTLIETKAKQQK